MTELRRLRQAANLSQAHVAAAAGISREHVSRLELGRVAAPDLRVMAVLFTVVGHRLSLKAFPTGEPLRDTAHLRLLERFEARIPPGWRRWREAPMPIPGDLRAWDALLRGPVVIGVEAETRPRDLQAVERAMGRKKRDSHVDRMALVIASTSANERMVRAHIAALRQTFPLDTRAFMAAIRAERDPGADALVLL